MDNEVILKIGDKELHFKLKSQIIVTLEKVFGKNIFEIFQGLSFISIQRIMWECLVNKTEFADANELMDFLMTKYSLLDLGGDIMQEIAIKSGILKQKDTEAEENTEESLEQLKND